MTECMIGLSIDGIFGGDHNNPEIRRFIEQFCALLHTDGRKPSALAEIGVDTDFPIRLLVGIPKASLTREQRLLAESFCGLVLGHNLGDTQDLWTESPKWTPTNLSRVPAPLDRSTLDVNWMLSLGIPRIVWEKTILSYPAALQKQTIHDIERRPQTLMRFLLWLSIFGFADPYQFFTAKESS